VSEFHFEASQAIAKEGLAQGPYVAARARFETSTFQTKGVESTNEPPRPICSLPFSVICSALNILCVLHSIFCILHSDFIFDLL